MERDDSDFQKLRDDGAEKNEAVQLEDIRVDDNRPSSSFVVEYKSVLYFFYVYVSVDHILSPVYFFHQVRYKSTRHIA
jgi:hypothetical protein